MPFNSTQSSFDNKLADLKKAVGWLESIGIKLASTRIDSYQRDITSIIEALNANNMKGLKQNETFEKVANSLYESCQVIDIHKGLSVNSLSLGLKSRLELLSHGPIQSSSEKTHNKSHEARDVGFELLMASLFSLADYDIDLDQNADIFAKKDGQSFFVECKRPRHEKSLLPAVDKAISQLNVRLSTQSDNLTRYGIIAISADLILHQKQDIIDIPNIDVAGVALRGSLNELISDHNYFWLNTKNPKIIGILILLQVSAVLTDLKTLTRCNYLLGNNIVDLSSHEGSVFKNLVSQLGSAMSKI